MESKDYKACLMLGGNLNDVQSSFVRALEKIGAFAKITKKSAMYRTKAWGMADDVPDFINQAVLAETLLDPEKLLAELKNVEKELGRKAKQGDAYESRTIDIDIIFFDDLVIKEEDLIIPHPRMHLRNFVLVPLDEIIPEYQHPVFHKNVRQLLLENDDNLQVIRIE